MYLLTLGFLGRKKNIFSENGRTSVGSFFKSLLQTYSLHKTAGTLLPQTGLCPLPSNYWPETATWVQTPTVMATWGRPAQPWPPASCTRTLALAFHLYGSGRSEDYPGKCAHGSGDGQFTREPFFNFKTQGHPGGSNPTNSYK